MNTPSGLDFPLASCLGKRFLFSLNTGIISVSNPIFEIYYVSLDFLIIWPPISYIAFFYNTLAYERSKIIDN